MQPEVVVVRPSNEIKNTLHTCRPLWIYSSVHGIKFITQKAHRTWMQKNILSSDSRDVKPSSLFSICFYPAISLLWMWSFCELRNWREPLSKMLMPTFFRVGISRFFKGLNTCYTAINCKHCVMWKPKLNLALVVVHQLPTNQVVTLVVVCCVYTLLSLHNSIINGISMAAHFMAFPMGCHCKCVYFYLPTNNPQPNYWKREKSWLVCWQGKHKHKPKV